MVEKLTLSDTRVVVLALGRVPSIDATGFVALESAVMQLRALKKLVVLAGALPQPRRIFDRANLPQHHEHVRFTETLDDGLALAAELVRTNGSSASASSGPPSEGSPPH